MTILNGDYALTPEGSIAEVQGAVSAIAHLTNSVEVNREVGMALAA